MSETTIRPLYIQLRPSKLLGCGLSLMTAMSVVMVLLLPLIWAAQMAFITMLLLWAVTVIRQRVFFRHTDVIAALEVDAYGHVYGTTVNRDKHSMTIRPDTVVTAFCVVLRYDLPNQSGLSLVLLPDMLDAQAFRRLRVWLRWGNPFHANQESSPETAGLFKRLQKTFAAWRSEQNG